jgi:hypothetical protein
MKRFLFVVIGAISLLCAPRAAHAAIAFGTSQICPQSTTGTLTCTASLTVANNDVITLFASTGDNTHTFSVSDSCGQSWVHQTSASGAQGTTVQVDSWTVGAAIAGTCSITVTRSSGGSIRFAWIAANYTGVSAIGNGTFHGNASSGSCSISEITQDPNNYVVAGMANAVLNETYTATSGTVRNNVSTTGSGSNSIGLLDNNAGSPSSVTNAANLGTSTPCAAGAIELRGTGVAGGPALLSDSGLMIQFNCSIDCNYTLPPTPPSAQWNATVQATSTHVYQVAVQSPATLNNQSSSITVPQWAAFRLIADSSGKYWVPDPPFVGGAGIKFAYGPISRTISLLSADSTHSATVTTGSGTSIGSTSLCSAVNCPAGVYRVNLYLDVTTACTTTGSYAVSVIYTDDQGAKTVAFTLSGTGVASNALGLASTSNFAQASQVFRSTGAASINYSTTAVACGTGGPAVGKMYLNAEQLQ